MTALISSDGLIVGAKVSIDDPQRHPVQAATHSTGESLILCAGSRGYQPLLVDALCNLFREQGSLRLFNA
jgi:hypothetical protein